MIWNWDTFCLIFMFLVSKIFIVEGICCTQVLQFSQEWLTVFLKKFSKSTNTQIYVFTVIISFNFRDKFYDGLLSTRHVYIKVLIVQRCTQTNVHIFLPNTLEVTGSTKNNFTCHILKFSRNIHNLLRFLLKLSFSSPSLWQFSFCVILYKRS